MPVHGNPISQRFRTHFTGFDTSSCPTLRAVSAAREHAKAKNRAKTQRKLKECAKTQRKLKEHCAKMAALRLTARKDVLGVIINLLTGYIHAMRDADRSPSPLIELAAGATKPSLEPLAHRVGAIVDDCDPMPWKRLLQQFDNHRRMWEERRDCKWLKNLASERWTHRLQEEEIITFHKAMEHFDFEDLLRTALCELAKAYGT
ncbi:uncharacterized protein B0I36DRAFT_166249 [Microdochium trichocladiopsis]|uniref:Uncharacterized protein n=1 Tax=Microdochium trichocladiopsis TaxID=1682393 RepID=A0A9P8XZ12_9PEZI|nr:uncharacterized protein B0I36DRAFT_166249 [Microdochium trichocladiopsis]KAH7025144.1 hypothetical protein B0I36DRAFT_166249 [Microdochium trichocladiopsis]